MPSVNSSSRPKVWPSSTFTTPSLPTFSIASAITSPISRSRAEMVATRAMSSLPEISLACDLMSSTTAVTADSMPRLSAIGLAPAETFLRPSRTIAWASTVCAMQFLLRLCGNLALAGDDLREDVRLAQDQVLIAGILDLGAAVLGEDDLVAVLDVERHQLPVFVATGAGREHLASLRLLL